MRDLYGNEMSQTPCDFPDENGNHHCPYEDFGGAESERCRVCCGLGVSEDPYPWEEENWDYDFEDEEPYCYTENEEGELVPVYVRDIKDC